MIDPTTINIGETITVKKKHPCGGQTWIVKRIGIDWKLECTTCQRVIMISRLEALKRIK